jgi:hypothetical protein
MTLPNDINLMDFVTDPTASDWRPYFNAAVAFAATNHPAGVRIHVPSGKMIPLSYVDPILSDGVTFVGSGRAVFTAQYPAVEDTADIVALPTNRDMFTWGDNTYLPEKPGGFTTNGGGLEGLNFRMWNNTGALAVTKGVANPKFSDIWGWILYRGIRIENGYDPEITNVTLEGCRHSGIEINGTGVGVGPDPRAGRGDRGVLFNVLVSGEGDEVTPTSIAPLFSVRGYWHTLQCNHVQVVKGGGSAGIFIGDRRNGNANQRPHFIIMQDVQVDFVKTRGIVVDDAVDAWMNQVYLNNAPFELLYINQNVSNCFFDAVRGYGSYSRMVTVAGKTVKISDSTFRNWNADGVSTETCAYITESADDVSFRGCSFGAHGGASGGGSNGRLAIYSPPNSPGGITITDCAFLGLAADPVLHSGPGPLVERNNRTATGILKSAFPEEVTFGTKIGVSADTLPGSSAITTGGDISIGGGVPALFFNAYYDGATFRYRGNGPAFVLKATTDGLAVQSAPANTAGAGAIASMTVERKVALV